MKKAAIVSICCLLLFPVTPAFAQEKTLKFQSSHTNWVVKISGEGNDPFLTNTNYYLSLWSVAKSLPKFSPRDPSWPKCLFRPIDIYDKTDGGEGDYVFGTSLTLTIEVNNRPIQISDPETSGGKNIVMNLDIDESGRLVAPTDNANYFSLKSGEVERDPIVVVFPFAGEYTLRYKAITFQNQVAISRCGQSSSPQFIETSTGTINFGVVTSKSAYEETKKNPSPSPTPTVTVTAQPAQSATDRAVIEALSQNLTIIQSELKALKAKLKKICSSKPKPKGC